MFGQSERLPLDFVTIRDFFHAFSSAANLTQTGSYHAQVHSASDLLQLPIKVSHRRHIHSVHHPGSQRFAALHREQVRSHVLCESPPAKT